MSVADNLAYGLKLRKMDRGERDRRVRDIAGKLGLEELLDRKPKALSGGQRQRVAMGRAIVREPKVFLMDEPLSNLDAKLRVSTRTQIAALQRRLGITTVYVTHDQTEAMTMGDRVAVLKDGLLQQNDTPLNLYDKPNNLFVAGFIGSPAMNLLEGKVTNTGIDVGAYTVPLEASTKSKLGSETSATVGIRPEAFRIVGAEENGLSVEVAVVEELGADAYLYGLLNGGGEEQKEIIARIDARRPPEKGAKVKLAADPERIHLFSTATGERVSG
jgi:multiple sugar transport system ATP-binding protein